MQPEEFFANLSRRYGNIDPADLDTILCPVLIPINSIDPTPQKIAGQNHWHAIFTVALTAQNETLVVPGRTGKFVPSGIFNGEPWREICKGRFLSLGASTSLATGEIYIGSSSSKSALEKALETLSADDYLEIDQFGAAAKVLSSLVEHSLAKLLATEGYTVRRMPEDMAQHIGTYKNYDFEATKGGITKSIEVKSIWGTNTAYARLIHSKGRDYPTSSCKFETQDIFAVSLFLRTGNIQDFAFARSVSNVQKPYGLSPAGKFPAHVNQNPICTIGDGTWFATLDEVWNLE